MLKKAVSGITVALCMAAVAQSHVNAQGRGGRGRGPELPTEEQMAESSRSAAAASPPR